jgi:hypothetical protein
MAQCDLCYKDDDNITEEMLKNEGIEDTDDYFLSWRENTVCKDCYYKRDKWDKESINDTDGIYARKHTCELCKTKHDLDDGFLDISDICDDFDNAVDKYETENNVNFSNFWCFGCADKTIKQIERTIE